LKATATKERRIHDKAERLRAWCENLPAGRWSRYSEVISEAKRRGIPFAVGGGLAMMAYAGQVRDSKDIDLYVTPENREAMIAVVLQAGLVDYYDRAPYDRNWIFRSCREDLIIDVMWAMANQRAQVDQSWLDGPSTTVDELTFPLVRPEETLWTKLYVMQRDRCDWPDALNILNGIGPELDWARLLERLGDDMPLLAGLLQVFRWIYPPRYNQLPQAIRTRLGLPEAVSGQINPADRARLLDTRPWFTETLEEDRRL